MILRPRDVAQAARESRATVRAKAAFREELGVNRSVARVVYQSELRGFRGP